MLARPSTLLPTTLATFLLLASPARAQYYNGYYGNNGTGYGTRIGIGVGVALGVALIILGIGWMMRRRRARAFKAAYPVTQAYTQPTLAQNQSYHSQQPQYGQAAGFNNANNYEMGQQQGNTTYQAPPGYSGYRQDSSSGANNGETPYYPPPQSPPPAANTSTYAPPSGPPPGAAASYYNTNGAAK